MFLEPFVYFVVRPPDIHNQFLSAKLRAPPSVCPKAVVSERPGWPDTRSPSYSHSLNTTKIKCLVFLVNFLKINSSCCRLHNLTVSSCWSHGPSSFLFAFFSSAQEVSMEKSSISVACGPRDTLHHLIFLVSVVLANSLLVSKWLIHAWIVSTFEMNSLMTVTLLVLAEKRKPGFWAQIHCLPWISGPKL